MAFYSEMNSPHAVCGFGCGRDDVVVAMTRGFGGFKKVVGYCS